MSSRLGVVASLFLALMTVAPPTALALRADGTRGGAPLLPNISTL